MLFFIILGLIAATVHLKIRRGEECSLLPNRTLTLKPRMKLLFYPLTIILIVCLSTTVIRGYLGARYFQSYQNSTNSRLSTHDSRLLTP